jgi:hypothetical protein
MGDIASLRNFRMDRIFRSLISIHHIGVVCYLALVSLHQTSARLLCCKTTEEIKERGVGIS